MKFLTQIAHILTGWFRSYIYAPPRIKTLSEQRLEQCRKCDFAVEKDYLHFRGDEAHTITRKACSFCGCPVKEKSLVEHETCPMGLWKK